MFYLQQTSTCNISLSRIFKNSFNSEACDFYTQCASPSRDDACSCTVDLEPKAGQKLDLAVENNLQKSCHFNMHNKDPLHLQQRIPQFKESVHP